MKGFGPKAKGYWYLKNVCNKTTTEISEIFNGAPRSNITTQIKNFSAKNKNFPINIHTIIADLIKILLLDYDYSINEISNILGYKKEDLKSMLSFKIFFG